MGEGRDVVDVFYLEIFDGFILSVLIGFFFEDDGFRCVMYGVSVSVSVRVC